MKDRKLSIDFIRTFAIIFTIIIHVSNIYIYSNIDVNSNDFLWAIIYNSIARICVPLFFMISGVFLINEKYNYEKYIKRFKKYLILLFIWSIIYILARIIIYDVRYDVRDYLNVFVNSLFNANSTSRHLWFMYAIIGIYISLPFIQNMCKNLTKEQENLFLFLWMFFSGGIVLFVPFARIILGIDIDISYPIPLVNATYYLGYFISGHILYSRFNKHTNYKKNNITYLLIFIISTLTTIVFTYVFSIVNNSIYDSFLWYRSIFITVSSFMIFLLIITNEGIFKNNLITKFSSLSFGVYLIHVIFVMTIKHNYNILEYNSFWMIPLLTIIIYLCSILICLIIKKINIFNKLIN